MRPDKKKKQSRWENDRQQRKRPPRPYDQLGTRYVEGVRRVVGVVHRVGGVVHRVVGVPPAPLIGHTAPRRLPVLCLGIAPIRVYCIRTELLEFDG